MSEASPADIRTPAREKPSLATDGSRRRHSLLWSFALPTIAAVGILIAAVDAYAPRAVVNAALSEAVLRGQQTARQMQVMRAFYSEEVVAKATAGGAHASPDYRGDDTTIPVPTTFLLDVAEAFSDDSLMVRLVSPYPWPSRGERRLDDFQSEAWEFLSANPGERMVRREFVRDREVLRVAVGDVMSESCVACHNSSPSSPRRDWSVGDVRGIIEIVQPIDAITAGANALAWKLSIGISIAGGVLLAVLLANAMRLVRPLRDLKLAIHQIAGGRLDLEIPHGERRDELGTVARALHDLREETKERARAEAQISHMAHHDALSGLPNRVLFREEMERALARARRGEPVAILCIDLDHFKAVNDTLGHPFGDELIKQAAERLRACVRETDVVARLGGDEFAVVQVGSEQPVGATALAERIIAAVSEPYAIGDHQVVVGASVGVAVAPADGDDPDELLKNADMALYRSKLDGRAVYRFFETAMDARMQARRALELDLRKALAQDEFELHYQPLVNLAEDRVSGFEALLRWNHPSRGQVSPAEFIPLAEEIGLINAIGAWVLRRACADAATWPRSLKVAVNLSPAQFKTNTLVLDVVGALADSGLAPSRLELEITETVMLQETESTLSILHQLRELGVRISMDDFGTGYSSLSYLRKFPFDKIKIDQCFVRDLESTEDAVAIIRAVTGLGTSFGMATTAEGVETPEQLQRLRAEGCTEVQGYFFSPPMPIKNVNSILRRIRRDMRKVA